DRRCQAHRGRASFLDRLTTDIRTPIKSAGVRRAPLLRALASEQLLQSEARGGGPDHDIPIARLDLDALAVTDPGGLRDLAREPNRQAPSPSANDSLRHDLFRMQRDISSIFRRGVPNRTASGRCAVGDVVLALHLADARQGP